MSDYEPINITNWCTAGEEVLRDENPTLGLQTMRGLPFQVGSVDGSPNQRCYVSLHKGHGPVTIPIDKKRNIGVAPPLAINFKIMTPFLGLTLLRC